MKVNNEAISIQGIDVEISWYRMGHQFADLNDQDQYQFLVGMLDAIKHWEAPINSLMQMQYIAAQFDEHNPALKPELAKWLDDFSARLKS